MNHTGAMVRSLLGRPIAFIAARYHSVRSAGQREVLWVVLHSMELPESVGIAEKLGRLWARATGRVASSHYGVDADSTCGYVDEKDVAYHAAGLNENSIGIEQAGYASQSADDWCDRNSTSMIEGQTIPLVADICRRKKIPPRFATADDINARRPGITTHAEVTKAKRKSTHKDPGLKYPIAKVIQGVAAALADQFSPRPAVHPLPSALEFIQRLVEAVKARPVTFGEDGARVRFVQKLLDAKGFECVIDGKFGPKTRTAVIRFQQARGVKGEMGYVGATTITKLL